MEKDQEKEKGKVQKDDTKVTLMGREIGTEEQKRYGKEGDAGSSVWGVLLVFAGLILLLNSLNIVPWDVWERLWQFWPLLLIFFGLQIILGNSIVSRFVLTVLTVAAFTFIVLAALSDVSPSVVPVLPDAVDQWLMIWENIRR